METLRALGSRLAAAFAKESENHAPIEIPPQLPPLCEKLLAAFGKNDFIAINEAAEALDALKTVGALKDEIDKIKEAVMMMDGEGAKRVIQGLLG